MRGFNPNATIPKRSLADVQPMRFNLIVKLQPIKEKSEYILMPESAKRHKDSTRGWLGDIVAVGESIPKMKKMLGAIKPGTTCLFDESVSIDDPNRCFDWEKDRFVMMDVETLMGVLPNGKKVPKMLGDRVLIRKPKKEDFKITKAKLWVPAGNEKQEVGGVVVAAGPGLYSHDTKKHLPMDFKAGQFVLFGKYSNTEININDVDYAVVRQDKILAIVHGEAERVSFT